MPAPPVKLPPVHWREGNPGSARNAPALASPLGEPNLPRPQKRSAAGLDSIVDWLAVETSRRYRAGRGVTFCNIYACDFAYIAGAYLPRVWWTKKAIVAFARGERPAARYGVTLVELNANALHDWLLEHGGAFGWRRAASPAQLQAHANSGGVALICARRRDPSRSGHVAIVAPEGALKARRSAKGEVTMPVLSQAGAVNYRRRVPPRPWWSDTKFSSVVMFCHG